MDKRTRFLKFLAKNDALIPYILNFNKESFLEFTISYMPEDFIACAFIWNDAPQGFYYWSDLDDEWRHELYF